MTRQKFRVWDTQSNTFLKPNDPSDEGRSQPWILITLFGEVITGADNQGAFVNKNQSDYVIQQNTFIKDKNNQELYEGDIVSTPDGDQEDYSNALMIVEYHYGSWCYREIGRSRAEPIFNYMGSCCKDDEALIIGNIFENKELL